jgi:hypothetical protein
LPILAEHEIACLDCGLIWAEKLIYAVVVDVWTAHVKSLRCPDCGAGYRRIAFWVPEEKREQE